MDAVIFAAAMADLDDRLELAAQYGFRPANPDESLDAYEQELARHIWRTITRPEPPRMDVPA